MGSKSNIMSYVSAVRCYLKKEEPEETEESPLFAQADNPGSTEIFISPSTGIQFVLIPAGNSRWVHPPKRKRGQIPNLRSIK